METPAPEDRGCVECDEVVVGGGAGGLVSPSTVAFLSTIGFMPGVMLTREQNFRALVIPGVLSVVARSVIAITLVLLVTICFCRSMSELSSLTLAEPGSLTKLTLVCPA